MVSLEEQVIIGLFALESQQCTQGSLVGVSLTRELPVGHGAFAAQDFILSLAFRVDERPLANIRTRLQQFLVGARPLSQQHLVRAATRGAYGSVGGYLDVARSPREL
ncbi:MAG TPA: hypothetical protein VM686_29750 [Polyangiaceae bacterium]|nr:hypothetical protein [Polyangiaceae bacterium]